MDTADDDAAPAPSLSFVLRGPSNLATGSAAARPNERRRLKKKTLVSAALARRNGRALLGLFRGPAHQFRFTTVEQISVAILMPRSLFSIFEWQVRKLKGCIERASLPVNVALIFWLCDT